VGGSFVFPEGEVPLPPPPHEPYRVFPHRLPELTRIPIQVVFGDTPDCSDDAGKPRPVAYCVPSRRGFLSPVNRTVAMRNSLHLPEIGILQYHFWGGGRFRT